MRIQKPVSLLAIVFGALETAGGVQELVYRGIMNSETEPLIVGTLGTVAGALLLVAGVALLLGSSRALSFVEAAAFVAVPVYVFIGIIKHYAGWPITTIGIIYPVLMFIFCKLSEKRADAAPKM